MSYEVSDLYSVDLWQGACVASGQEVVNMRLACTLFLALAAAAQVLTLQDGTPVRLRLNRTISSATANVGETVDFEVTEPVINQNYVVIPKGAVALGRVTKVETKRRFGRAGALELSIDAVRLPDGRTIPLRATPEKDEGDMSGARVAATIVASMAAASAAMGQARITLMLQR